MLVLDVATRSTTNWSVWRERWWQPRTRQSVGSKRN